MKIKCLTLLLIAFVFNAITVSAQTWLWGQQGNTGLKAESYDNNVATNKTGNLYQTGGYYVSATFGSITLNSASQGDLFLVKYDKNGNVLWAQTSVTTIDGSAWATSVASDDSDNAYVLGYGYNYVGYRDTVTLGSKTLILPTNGYLFLVKYDAKGNVVWATQPDSNIIYSGTIGYGVAADKSGNVYVTGSGGFLIKYDRNGKVIWTTLPSTYSNYYYYNSGFGVAVDNSGNSYICGQFQQELTYGTYNLYSSSLVGDQFIAKFDKNGNVLWANQSTNNSYNYNYYNYYENSVTVDQSGSSFLTGSFSDTINFGSYEFTAKEIGVSDFFIVKYNPDGSIAWGKQAILNILDKGWNSYSICSDDSNRIYLSGGCGEGVLPGETSFTFSNYTASLLDTDDFDAPAFILKMDSTGNVLCGSTIPDGGYAQNGITTDSSGKFVYMGGLFEESFNLGSYSLINTTGGEDIYTGRWIPCDECNFAVTVNQPAVICSGLSDTLTANGGDGYTWSPSTGLNTTTGSSVLASPTLSTTYTVTCTNDNGCLGIGTEEVTVISSPNIPSFVQHNDTLTSSSKHDNQWYRNDTLLKNDTSQVIIISILGEYWVTVLNEVNGCSSTSDSINITSLIGTGIEQVSADNELSVYPNPTNDQLTVNSVQLPITEIEVENELGQIIFVTPESSNGNLTKQIINLGNLPSGIYFISTITNSGRTVVPVVKE